MGDLSTPDTAAEGAILVREDIHIAVLASRTYVRVKLPPRSVDELTEVRIFGESFPLRPGTCTDLDPAIWCYARDSWLFTSSALEAATLTRALVDSWGPAVAAIDCSDSLMGFVIRGEASAELLVRGTAVDVAELSPGQCVRTRYAQLPVLMKPYAQNAFELIVDRGPASWFANWLVNAAAML